MGFDQIIGHLRIIMLIRAMLERGRLPHAILITGPPGVGKTCLALAVAQAANCTDIDKGAPCGVCSGCSKALKGVHPDISILEPEGRLQVIKIDSIRELRNQAALRPYEGLTKVFILKGADHMQEPAASALLKTLEEPPPSSLIILTAVEEGDVLPTVLSRCFRFGLSPLPQQMILDWLMDNVGITGPRASLLASLSRGCLGRIIDQDSDTVWDTREKMIELLNQLNPQAPAPAISWAEELARDEVERELMFDLLKFWYRDLMLLASDCRDSHLVNADLKSELSRFRDGKAPQSFIGALDEIEKAEDALSRMARADLVMENLMLNLAAI